MEQNVISLCMEVKLSINDKRSDAIKLKSWTRCEVKIEAVKCLPSFLRLTFLPCLDGSTIPLNIKQEDESVAEEPKSFTVTVIVPGVSISLATSRTKQHSYGLFWTQNRRDCFIYFSLETESICRRHMKWMRKSIKNLELHRLLCLEPRRNSRDCRSGRLGLYAQDLGKETEVLPIALGPLPKLPDNSDTSWSRRVSHVSNIYEEICIADAELTETPRLSRRLSRTSLASGIYEEMKSPTSNFNSIAEELLDTLLPPTPPPLPPLPSQRKRINTFEMEQYGLLGAIPRSNTNPESDLAKKKKYKNVLDNIFHSGRSKRAKSVSESHTGNSTDGLIDTTPKSDKKVQLINLQPPIYANQILAVKNVKQTFSLTESKRHSFSSPDLSKINFVDTFDEEKVADIFKQRYAHSDDESKLSIHSLNELPKKRHHNSNELAPKLKVGSLESLNVSEQLPLNFNFSACNSSTINLVGANGAAPLSNPPKNKILIDEVTGYCVMAPIKPKNVPVDVKRLHSNGGTESTSSGYCTSSYSSSSSYGNSVKDQINNMHSNVREQLHRQVAPPPSEEESVVYVNMNDGDIEREDGVDEVVAAQELEQPPSTLTTSTPTDSPLTPAIVAVNGSTEEQENYYQTPRKSIISVDEKIPSYYPNSCESNKTRRSSQQSPQKNTLPSSIISEKTPTSNGLRHLVKMKMLREPKENLNISPQQLAEQRNDFPVAVHNANANKNSKVNKNKKTAAHKISDNVYTVIHPQKNSNSNSHSGNTNAKSNSNARDVSNDDFGDDMRDQLQKELLQLAMLQSIDFKFDDTKTLETAPVISANLSNRTDGVVEGEGEGEENYYKVPHMKYTSPVSQRSPAHHHLKLNQEANTRKDTRSPAAENAATMTQSKLEVPLTVAAGDLQWGGMKKFASLPRFKKIDFSPLRLKIHNVLQRNQQQEF